MWSVTIPDAPAGAPVCAADLVVYPRGPGGVAAHRLADGAPAWTVDLVPNQPLAADDERVYVAAGEAIHALHTATGALAWRAAAAGPLTAPPLAHAGWVVAAAAGDLLGIRAADGQVLWRTHVGPVEFRPAIDGPLLVASVADGRLVALQMENGTVVWDQGLGSAPTEPFVVGGRVYVGTEDKRFLTLHADSGRVESRRAVGALLRGRAAIDERHVYFAAMDNTLWATDRRDGAIEWRKGLAYRPGGGPVLLGSLIVVPAQERALPAFSARDGADAGEIAFPARLAALPVLAQDALGATIAIGITGSLEDRWLLTMLKPSPYGRLPVSPLSALPGEAVPAASLAWP